MDDKKYRIDLWSQLKDAYGKVLYTYVSHQKHLWLVSLKRSVIGWLQIILTAVSSVGFLSIIITNTSTLAWIAGICSVLSLALNLYTRSVDIGEEVSKRRKTVDALWPIVQDYISLLTDFWNEDGIDEIKHRRQMLQDRTNVVYKEAPRTGWIAYKMAQKALKQDKEQSFDNDESDNLLPQNLRNRKECVDQQTDDSQHSR